MNKNDIAEFDEFIDQIQCENARSVIILFASKIDQLLYLILLRFLLPATDKKEDELLQGDNPLSTFSAKIKLCSRLGLVDINFTRGLHLIRKIRNRFAHHTDAALDKSPIREHVRELVKISYGTELFNNVKEVYFRDATEKANDLHITLTIFAMRLIAYQDKIQQVEQCSKARLIPEHEISATT